MENTYGCNENAIEWLRDQRTATVTITQQTLKSRLLDLAEEYPNEVKIIAKNHDGSICAHIPRTWVKITPPRRIDEELRTKLAEMARERFSQKQGLLSETNEDED